MEDMTIDLVLKMPISVSIKRLIMQSCYIFVELSVLKLM